MVLMIVMLALLVAAPTYAVRRFRGVRAARFAAFDRRAVPTATVGLGLRCVARVRVGWHAMVFHI